jgi:ATP-dependent Clp protease ATP-binding subunit ClpC
MLENLTERARRTLFFARYEAARAGAAAIGSEHLLLGLLRESDEIVEQLLQRFQLSSDALRADLGPAGSKTDPQTPAELPLAEDSRRILLLSAHEAEVLGQPAVGNEHLLLGILRLEGCSAARALATHGMSLVSVREELGDIWREREIRKGKRELAALGEFARDLTEFAAAGGFDPLVGREQEVDRIVQILLRRTKNNPVLLGEPGVGKTAIVEGLAQRIASGRVPIQLADRRILALDLSLVVAGTKYRGQFEERLKAVLKELKENPEIIVFIDELHVLIGAGSAEGSLDAANILKPALSRGEVTCIGATTLKEYRKYIEKDRSLSRRFQPVVVQPPDESATLGILQGVRERYEKFHNVRYTEEALRAAVVQAGRYITDRFFPDKAIDVLDEAGARVKLRGAASTEQLRQMQGEAGRVVREMKRASWEFAARSNVFRRRRQAMSPSRRSSPPMWRRSSHRGPGSRSQLFARMRLAACRAWRRSCRSASSGSGRRSPRSPARYGVRVWEWRAACARSGRSSSSDPRGWERPRRRVNWPGFSSIRTRPSCASTCPSTWRNTRCRS